MSENSTIVEIMKNAKSGMNIITQTGDMKAIGQSQILSGITTDDKDSINISNVEGSVTVSIKKLSLSPTIVPLSS